MKDEDGNWPRQLVMGMGALLVVALVIGGIVSVVALAAANVAGVGSASSSAPPSLYIPPRDTSSPSPSPSPAPSQAPAAQTPTATTSSPTPHKKREHQKKKSKRIRLVARPTNANTFTRIYLTGTYRAPTGTTLQVQRFEGGWAPFPVSATVTGGRFETWVQSGQDGKNKFRMVDGSTGRTSTPVTVTLR